MKTAYLRAFALAIFALAAFPALAQTTVAVGSLFGSFEPYVRELVGVVVAALLGWVAMTVKAKFGIDIEARHREAIETFVTNQAGALIAKVGDPLKALTINVGNPTLAALANEALTRIPDAVKHFGLTPEKIAERIKAKLGLLSNAAPSVPVTAPPTA